MSQTSSTWGERLRAPLTWHYAGAAVLLVLVLVLGVRLAIDWSATGARSTEELTAKQLQLKALTLQTEPLRGLDKRVEASRAQIAEFYARRIPAHYSSIAEQMGAVAVKSGVRLSRLEYAQGAATADLTEITLDAGVGGSYPQIMQFINGLERSPNFFIIRAMSLTGQQGGMVNLRLRVSTWLRSAEVPGGLPQAAPAAAPATAPTSPEGE